MVLPRSAVFAVGMLLVAGCENRSSAPSPATSVASAAHVASPSASTPPPAPPAADAAPPAVEPTDLENSAYPIGDACKTPQALAKEKRSLPPRSAWEPITSEKNRLTVSVPPSVFKVTDDDKGLLLTSSVKANGLGPDAKPRPFAIRLRRVDKSVDELLADKSKGALLDGLYVEGAFPQRTQASFAPYADSTIGPGFAMNLVLSKKQAWIFVGGDHGYNTDATLVRVGPKDTVIASADWSSAVMAGQPECWQRQVIAGVMETLAFR
jgi:hypothetical protein